jgi:hypothetical protein
MKPVAFQLSRTRAPKNIPARKPVIKQKEIARERRQSRRRMAFREVF